MKRGHSATLVLSGIIIVLLALVGILFWKYQDAKGSSNQAQQTSERIIQKVSKLYLIPEGESPTVAQIQDKEKLGNQDFFKNSRNGDYLLVYQKAKVAIVYREDTNKLVTVGPVNFDEQNEKSQDGQDQEDKTADTDAPAN